MSQTTVLDKVDFTKRQQEAVNFDGKQMLVRGIAGSGKTLVLMGKAVKVAKKYPTAKILFISYGEPLSKAISEQLSDAGFNNIQVTTFSKWIAKVRSDMKRAKYFNSKRINEILKKVFKQLELTYPNHRFLNDDRFLGFIIEEIGWIKGSANTKKADYLSASRRGRGSKVNVSKKDREVLFSIYELYEDEKNGEHDYEDDALYVYNHLDKISEDKIVDHIFIDEAQDLSKTGLTTLIHCAGKTCTVGADLGQKIYTTSFTWSEVGLNILGGRTKVLDTSFRSTKQIVLLAESLQSHDEIRSDEEYTALSIPEIEGPKPILFVAKSRESHNEALVATLKQLQKTDKDASIGVLIRSWESLWGKKGTENKGFNKDFKKYSLGFDLIKNRESGSHIKPGIHVTSFHTAKGLEFDYVVVADLIDPSQSERLGEEFDWNLERRLLYVAMTRAKLSLIMLTYNENAKLITELQSDLFDKKYL